MEFNFDSEFQVDVQKRATALELLQHPFLSKRSAPRTIDANIKAAKKELGKDSQSNTKQSF